MNPFNNPRWPSRNSNAQTRSFLTKNKLLKRSDEAVAATIAHKAVLRNLAWRAYDSAPITWVGNQTVAQYCQCSPKTVERALRSLSEDGHISTLRLIGVININVIHPNKEWCTRPERAALELLLGRWKKGNPKAIGKIIDWTLGIDPTTGGRSAKLRLTPDTLSEVNIVAPRHRVQEPRTKCHKTPDTMSLESQRTHKRKRSGARQIGEILSDIPEPCSSAILTRGGGRNSL